MATKLNNLLKFTEYDHLQPKQKPTAKTEVGGFAVLEKKSIEELLALAAEKSGKSEKKLKKLTPKKLKKLAGVKKDKKEDIPEGGRIPKDPAKEEPKEKEEKKDESLVTEKAKPTEKQLAARKKFAEMIAAKKEGKDPEKEQYKLGKVVVPKGREKEAEKLQYKIGKVVVPKKDNDKGLGHDVDLIKKAADKKIKEKEEKKNESLVLEASAKQKAARARFMEMINKKKGKSDKDGIEPSHKHYKAYKKK